MRDLKHCYIDYIDDIYEATRDSQGTKNALLAIKYVIFDIEEALGDSTPLPNKYLYISKTNNARKKAMLLQYDDLLHILTKYAMASFGLRGSDFNIKDEDVIIALKRIDRLEISTYELIEMIAYTAMNNILESEVLIFTNKKLLKDLVDYMLSERYISEFKDSLDNFSGIIDNEDIPSETRFRFYDAYSKIDETFAEIKKNDPNYIK